MGKKSLNLFNPCRSPLAQWLPAKIWELLHRNELFRREVKKLHALDERAKEETAKYSEIASQYNQAIADKDTARMAECQKCYDSVKDRPIRNEAFRLIEEHQKRHPLAALALQWLVPDPLFLASRVREGQAEEGTGLSPDLNHPSWIWWKSNAPQGAIGHYMVRGPEIAAAFEEWQNWCSGQALFNCGTPWNRLPKSFKSQFMRVWRQCYDSRDAYEFNYVCPPRRTDTLTKDDAARYLDFLDTVTSHRIFAVSPTILTTKDVGEVFERLQTRLKRGLPESREHLFGTEAAWRHYLAIKETKLSLARHIVGPGYEREDSTKIKDAVRNQRRNVQFGAEAIEKMVSLIYPTFEFKKIVLVRSAPPRDKVKRRKPQTIASAPKLET